MPEEVTFFAETNYRGQKRRFGIKQDDRRRHMYIIGKTGMGKTTMLEHMVYSDIINGNGLAVVDPHGDFTEKMIDYVPSNRINDVIYFNPADVDWPIAFNVMEKVDPKYMPLVASGLIGVFKKIWADSWGPRLEYVLRNAILALLEYPSSTLLGVPRILVDKNYRQKVVKKVTDPVVKSFWVDEFSRYPDKFQTEAIAPIQNKIGQFLSNSTVRNIVSQTKSSIDLRKAMDEQKILIINLAKGRIGEDYSALLGAMMITKLQLAAMSRVDIPEPDRKDFYLYVDEFQNFATESFANILSEARKYRLNLIIAHQYIGQLVTDQNTVVRDAVFGNVGTIVSFRIGAADAEFLEKEFEPVFMMNDLVNLPKYNVYLKLMIDGMTSDAFSATTLTPLGEDAKEGNGEKIIKNSRQRYSTPRAVIEEKIMKWSGMENESGKEIKEPEQKENSKNKKGPAGTLAADSFYARESSLKNGVAEPFRPRPPFPVPSENKVRAEVKTAAKPAAAASPAAERDQRVWYDAVCQKCLKAIQVPFKPDPARKTYCRECLRLVRMASSKEEKPAVKPFEKKRTADEKPAEQNFISLEEAMKSKPVSFSAKKPIPHAQEEKRAKEEITERKEEREEEREEREEERTEEKSIETMKKIFKEESGKEVVEIPITVVHRKKAEVPEKTETPRIKKTPSSGIIKPREKVRFE